jgi:O-antigen/teichoic acid export membrane protein
MSSSFVVLARLGLIGAWFLITLLMARWLGSAEFGVYVFCVTLIKLFSSFIADTLDLAVLRRAPVYLQEDRPRGLALVRVSLGLRIAVGCAAAGGVALLSPWLARRFLDSAQLTDLVLLAAAGILGDLLLRGALVYFQSAAQFGRFILLEGTVQLGRIALIGTLVLLDQLTARHALVIYVGMSYLVFALALAIAPRDVFRKGASGRQELLEVWHYGKWMITASAVAALSERMEILGVGYFLTPADLGVYGAALLLATIPEFIEGAVGTVLTPKVARMYREGRIPELQARYRRWSLPLCGAALCLVWLVGDWFIAAFLSDEFQLAGTVFKVQIIGALFWLALVPVSAALVAFVSARLLLGINLAGLLVRAAAGLLLIPTFGVMGAAIVFVTIRIGMSLTILIMGLRFMVSGAPPGFDQVADARAIEPSPTRLAAGKPLE